MICYLEEFKKNIRVDPILDLDDWSDMHRVLPEGKVRFSGKYSTARTPYMREILKSMSKSSATKRIVLFGGAQWGKTSAIENIIGQTIHQDPKVILVAVPTITFAERWSKERLQSMFEISDCFKGIIKDPRERDGGNTILLKTFRGGSLNIIGLNSAESMRGITASLLIVDELDSASYDIQGEGDFLMILEQRMSTFPYAKTILASTPTEKDHSRIEYEYLNSTQEHYYVHCPFCSHPQEIKFANLKWKDKDPDTARLMCVSCNELIEEKHKETMLDNGKWVAHNLSIKPESCRGFFYNCLGAPLGFKKWSNVVKEWLDAQGNQSKLKSFVNLVLGETWEESGESADNLASRRQKYKSEVPQNAWILTCGVDIQKDRLEALVIGWGIGEKSWVIEQEIFRGSPTDPLVWEQLDVFLQKKYKHESDIDLRILSTCIDTAGGYEKQAYAYCKNKLNRRIFAIKGHSSHGKPLISRPTKSNKGSVSLHMIGTDTAKRTLMSYFKVKDPNAMGYCSFNDTLDDEFFSQLMSEKLVTKQKNGFFYRQWVKIRARNEALDLFVYNLSALALLNPNWVRIAESFKIEKTENNIETEEAQNEEGQQEDTIEGEQGPKNLPKRVKRESYQDKSSARKPKSGFSVNHW